MKDKTLRGKHLQVRRMIEGEKYVDFNDKPLCLLGYVFYQLQVGEKLIRMAAFHLRKKERNR